MNKTISLYLDTLRAIAAICVVFHHYNNHVTEAGIKIFPSIGQEAVMVFFCMSGFVIAWVCDNKEKSWPIFIAKRLSTFYSVLFPSIFIILTCYFLAHAINPNVYPDYIDVGSKHILPKILLNISFLNYNSVFYDVRLPTASPLWSLTYLFWYYIIYAFIIFIPNKVIATVIVSFAFLFLGAKLILLWPVWLIGAFTYRLSKKIKCNLSISYLIFGISITLIFLMRISGLRQKLSMSNLFLMDSLHHSNYAFYFYILGLLICMNFFSIISISKVCSITLGKQIDNLIRRISGVSFTLYTTHLPIMFLLKALKVTNIVYMTPLLTIAIVLLIGPFIENSKFWYFNRIKFLMNSISIRNA
jgi:peptidoglycan/LPS O-acetylase OafA/YrhL